MGVIWVEGTKIRDSEALGDVQWCCASHIFMSF